MAPFPRTQQNSSWRSRSNQNYDLTHWATVVTPCDSGRMDAQPQPPYDRRAFYRRDRRSARLARRFTERTPAEWGVTERGDDMLLCVSGLATNVGPPARHRAGGQVGSGGAGARQGGVVRVRAGAVTGVRGGNGERPPSLGKAGALVRRQWGGRTAVTRS
ncbi:hypothetical protein GCM10010254_58520 [Streptomyces chromofuscus]|nr:hypothetical protein GCM10010254_58520 [Streptomyces chromofuscus]